MEICLGTEVKEFPNITHQPIRLKQQILLIGNKEANKQQKETGGKEHPNQFCRCEHEPELTFTLAHQVLGQFKQDGANVYIGVGYGVEKPSG